MQSKLHLARQKTLLLYTHHTTIGKENRKSPSSLSLIRISIYRYTIIVSVDLDTLCEIDVYIDNNNNV